MVHRTLLAGKPRLPLFFLEKRTTKRPNRPPHPIPCVFKFFCNYFFAIIFCNYFFAIIFLQLFFCNYFLQVFVVLFSKKNKVWINLKLLQKHQMPLRMLEYIIEISLNLKHTRKQHQYVVVIYKMNKRNIQKYQYKLTNK